MRNESKCQTCGTETWFGPPSPLACGDCPERECSLGCGERVTGVSELVSGGGACPCWVSVEDVPIADLKSSLAIDGFSLGLDGRLTR